MKTGQPADQPQGFRRVAPALGLFFLAPLVGEFLLGNMPITWLGTLLLLGPLYGGGALLIRELARRFNLAWPGIIVLGLTFGIIEEAFATQSLFNPNYLGLRLLDDGYIPALGIGLWWTVFVLSLHTIWSTVVPIALMETLTPGRRTTPWLGQAGVLVTGVIYAIGCGAIAAVSLKKGLSASPLQLGSTAVIVAGLVALAFKFGRQRPPSAPSGFAPPPLRVGIVAFLVGAAFFALVWAHSSIGAPLYAAGTLLLFAAAGALMIIWSRRAGWTERHRLALAAGFLLTYAWYGFVQTPSVGNVTPLIDHLGDVVFGSGAVALLFLAARRARSN